MNNLSNLFHNRIVSDTKLFVSFSGGKTSALMSKIIKESGIPAVFVFANTGQEHEETYKFVDKVDKELGLDLVWVEPVVHKGRRGTTHKVVTFETATRDHSLFAQVISKYGIPNTSYPHCTRELKLRPMLSYIKSLGWTDFYTAIGIRADEIDRIDKEYKDKKYWYPMADLGIDKEAVNKFWEESDYTLDLPELKGNCTWCWKKSFKKHVALIQECPKIYKVPAYFETEHSIPKRKQFETGKKRTFFRGNKSVKDLFELAKLDIGVLESMDDINESEGCQESCEPF